MRFGPLGRSADTHGRSSMSAACLSVCLPPGPVHARHPLPVPPPRLELKDAGAWRAKTVDSHGRLVLVRCPLLVGTLPGGHPYVRCVRAFARFPRRAVLWLDERVREGGGRTPRTGCGPGNVRLHVCALSTSFRAPHRRVVDSPRAQ